MEVVEKQPKSMSILEANLEQIKILNGMIDKWLANGTLESSLVIRQMKYERDKYLKEINEYLQKYEVSLVSL